MLLFLLFTCSGLGFFSLKLLLAVVQNLTDNRVGIRGNLNQIKRSRLGFFKGLFQRDDTYLLAICSNQAYLIRFDLLVNSGFF